MSQKKLNNEELETRLQFYKLKADFFASELKKECEEHEQFVKKVYDEFDKLNEENKEIADLKERVERQKMIIDNLSYSNRTANVVIRHQICKKIKAYLKENLNPIPSKLGCFAEINREDLFDKLDQIEKGEE